MAKYRSHILVVFCFALALFAATWTSSLIHQRTVQADSECNDNDGSGLCAGDDGGVSGGSCGPKDKDVTWWDTCHGGTWRREAVTSNSITINNAGGVSGGTIAGCESVGADVFYRLALVKYKTISGANDYSGQQVGLLPVNKFVGYGGYAKFDPYCNNDSTGAPDRPCMGVAERLFEAAKKKYPISASFSSISWFCWNDKWLNTYESKSNAYSPLTGTTVSSEWVDGATDKYLEIDAKAGDTVEVHLNQLIRATNNTKNSTDWVVIRTDRATHDGVTFEDTSYGGSASTFAGLALNQGSGTLTTEDTDPHPLPNPPSGSSNHRIKVKLPADDPASYSVVFCEQINYQSASTYDSSNPKDKWSYVCVKINVGPSDDMDTSTPSDSCPLPLSIYTPPAPGTIHHGDTDSGSGVQLTGQTWVTSLYAKPTDNITFAHCVNPEAQAVKKTEDITEGHGQPCNDVDDDHNLWVMDSNTFRIDTENRKVRAESGLGLITNPQQITFTSSSGFSGGSGYSATFSGIPHETTPATIYSSNIRKYYVNIGSAGGFMQQSVTTDVSYADENKTEVDSWIASACTCCYRCTCTCSDDYGSWPCCCSCPCSPEQHTHWYFPGKTAPDGSPSSAWVYVPYNFTTSGTTNIYQGHTDRANEQVVLPDESFQLTASISINTRSNSATNGTYATEPPADTKLEVVTFYLRDGQSIPAGSGSAATSSVCSFYSGQGALNCQTVGNYPNRDAWMSHYPSYSSGSTYTFGYNLRVQNVPDGYMLCSAIGISHADSKNDTNDNAAGAVNDNWNIIGPTCRSVANNPNTQIWGGSFLSNGHVKTSSTIKPSVSNRTFGSWSEFAVIAGGNTGYIEGLGSGASLGYINSYYNNSKAGGNSNSLFYVRTPLAISNSDCIRNNSCNAISPSGITSNSTVMSRLITRFISNAGITSNVSGGSVNLAASSSYNIYNGYRITHASGDITVSSSSNLPINTTHIIYSEGNITINSNLLYDKTNSGNYYTSISQIPQYVIIAKGNIYIASQVEEVDAWLIAENGTLDTCANREIGSGVNSSAGASGCGSQLTVNGPIIAQSILPKRAYGAGAQDSSGGAVGVYNDQYNVTGAEVFNLSSYSYLWAFAQAYRNTEPHTVYTRILAPRL